MFRKDHMKRNLAILSILLVHLTACLGAAQAGQVVLAVQSIRIQPYEEALNGFESVVDASVRRLILSEMNGSTVSSRIKEIKPAVILAIGMDALKQVGMVTDIPVIYLMVLNPPSAVSGKKNIYGVKMNIPQDQQLRVLLDALPSTKTVGLLYNPDRTGDLVEKTRDAARKIGVRIMATAVNNSKSVPSLIREMEKQIDVFLMLPDLTVVTPETVEVLFLFSLGNKIPVVAFSEKYVEMGALISTGIDAYDMGAQAGDMAERILSGGDLIKGSQIDPRKAVISLNPNVARMLGITVDERIARKAKIID